MLIEAPEARIVIGERVTPPTNRRGKRRQRTYNYIIRCVDCGTERRVGCTQGLLDLEGAMAWDQTTDWLFGQDGQWHCPTCTAASPDAEKHRDGAG